jgi:hypothetical protein
MLKRDLLPKCPEAGIASKGRMSLSKVKSIVRKFFIELHEEEGVALHQSTCYVAKAQAIERKIKLTSAAKRKNSFAADTSPRKSRGTVANPKKKKDMLVNQIMSKFPDEGFFVTVVNGQCMVRCSW